MCEVSGFDEPQRQWGWGGFTTQDLHRSQLTARAVALIYNGWSWTVRAVSHAGQTMLYLTPMHAEAGLIKSMIANVHAAISHVRRAAEQLPGLDQWATLVDYICRKIVGQFALPTPLPALTATG